MIEEVAEKVPMRAMIERNKVWIDQKLRATVIERFCLSGPKGGYTTDYGKVRVSEVLNHHLENDTIFMILMEEVDKKKVRWMEAVRRNKKLDRKILNRLMTIAKVKFDNGKIIINDMVTISRKDLLKHRSRIATAEHPIPTSGEKNFYDLNVDVQAEIKNYLSHALDPQPVLRCQIIK